MKSGLGKLAAVLQTIFKNHKSLCHRPVSEAVQVKLQKQFFVASIDVSTSQSDNILNIVPVLKVYVSQGSLIYV